ncbi:hypothetical protein DCS_03460 [Drechmeria coniospora]|uniref:FAD dependent oxidoreductase domain-containing protein n=1 Tax=Drechmeria coniospora TaxID=98403 RepID=A0A151GHA5_DRECN|nr:hypothetical protein DCS_03460 [Drechmeria coniospora]KYK56460.1 hypothetical protein DCS_03460 [Drechmeria coniospora]
MTATIFDIVVIGGGPVGMAAAYEAAKAGARVALLEQNNFFNQAGSSGDLARMFRTMYTEDYMADLAKEAMQLWDALEKDSGTSLRWMSGLLNFGDKDIGGGTPEVTAKAIEGRYPFKNLPADWVGLFSPDNGVINVQLLLRTLLNLAKDYGAEARQHTQVQSILPPKAPQAGYNWEVNTLRHGSEAVTFKTNKVIIASGSYVNHVLKPSFGFSLDLDIWEMVASYFNTNAGPEGTIFPSMWFQFAPDKQGRSQLFYGFPTLPWGPPNVVRIAVDAASRRIKDPTERQTNVVNPDDVRDTQDFVREHVVGVDATVPASTLTCLQTNVFDNMFVLDFVPQEYLRGGPKDSVVVFTAGWAMKFVPMLGKALAEMAIRGGSKYALSEFSMTRKDPTTGKGIIVNDKAGNGTSFAFAKQASGSSYKGVHNMGR